MYATLIPIIAILQIQTFWSDKCSWQKPSEKKAPLPQKFSTKAFEFHGLSPLYRTEHLTEWLTWWLIITSKWLSCKTLRQFGYAGVLDCDVDTDNECACSAIGSARRLAIDTVKQYNGNGASSHFTKRWPNRDHTIRCTMEVNHTCWLDLIKFFMSELSQLNWKLIFYLTNGSISTAIHFAITKLNNFMQHSVHQSHMRVALSNKVIPFYLLEARLCGMLSKSNL